MEWRGGGLRNRGWRGCLQSSRFHDRSRRHRRGGSRRARLDRRSRWCRGGHWCWNEHHGRRFGGHWVGGHGCRRGAAWPGEERRGGFLLRQNNPESQLQTSGRDHIPVLEQVFCDLLIVDEGPAAALSST